jgi:predicted metalloprotease
MPFKSEWNCKPTCLSGVWANHAHEARNLLEKGDIEEGLTAAAIGDDTLQRKTQGHVVPESFTHGSAKQRQKWFSRGFKSGDMADCDTFSGNI